MQGAAEVTRVPSHLYHMNNRTGYLKCVHVHGQEARSIVHCTRPFVFEISSTSSCYINMYRRSDEQCPAWVSDACRTCVGNLKRIRNFVARWHWIPTTCRSHCSQGPITSSYFVAFRVPCHGNRRLAIATGRSSWMRRSDSDSNPGKPLFFGSKHCCLRKSRMHLLTVRRFHNIRRMVGD